MAVLNAAIYGWNRIYRGYGMSSSIGKIFTVTTFGESHGAAVGAIVDGCPAGIEVSEAYLQKQLDRRRPGQSDLTTPRSEADTLRILSGIEGGRTLGSPVMLVVDNKDKRPGDYKEALRVPRPSHADYTYKAKYGVSSTSGGGRASARETVGRVLGGSVAEIFLASRHGVEIVAWVSSVGSINAADVDVDKICRQDVDATAVRCPDGLAADEMSSLIRAVRDAGDSIGGIITCVCRNVPAGWGEPLFDKINAALAFAMLSIPAVKGFEVGSGFAGTCLRGSVHNDMFVKKGDRLGTATNRSGGIQGGITNGEPIIMKVAFKPTASIAVAQETVDFEGGNAVLEFKGRHDPCVLPRAVPVVEAMAAIVLADMSLIAD